MSNDDDRCTRCGLPADALIHTGNHPTNCHPFESLRPLPGQCADCGHNADAHDEEDGHCLVGAFDGERCDCVGFEVQL